MNNKGSSKQLLALFFFWFEVWVCWNFYLHLCIRCIFFRFFHNLIANSGSPEDVSVCSHFCAKCRILKTHSMQAGNGPSWLNISAGVSWKLSVLSFGKKMYEVFIIFGVKTLGFGIFVLWYVIYYVSGLCSLLSRTAEGVLPQKCTLEFL